MPTFLLFHLRACPDLVTVLSSTLPSFLPHPKLLPVYQALHGRLTRTKDYMQSVITGKVTSQGQLSALSELFRERSKVILEIVTIRNEVANWIRAGGAA